MNYREVFSKLIKKTLESRMRLAYRISPELRNALIALAEFFNDEFEKNKQLTIENERLRELLLETEEALTEARLGEDL